MGRLFTHEMVRPSSPVCGFLCVRGDYTHPQYPGVEWSPGNEFEGHFELSTQPLGSLPWLNPADRLRVRVIECAVVPGALIGGGRGTVEAGHVVVATERSHPFGPHSDSLQAFWSEFGSGPKSLDQHQAVLLAREALLRFRLYRSFRCRGISIVRSDAARSGWASSDDPGWLAAGAAARDELYRLGLRALRGPEWQAAAEGIEALVAARMPGAPHLADVQEHVLYSSYAVSSGPAGARLNPFGPLVTLAEAGLPALGLVGSWFCLGGGESIGVGRYPFRGGWPNLLAKDVL